jgi:hypothetical protein
MGAVDGKISRLRVDIEDGLGLKAESLDFVRLSTSLKELAKAISRLENSNPSAALRFRCLSCNRSAPEARNVSPLSPQSPARSVTLSVCLSVSPSCVFSGPIVAAAASHSSFGVHRFSTVFLMLDLWV